MAGSITRMSSRSAEVAGLDALEAPTARRESTLRRAWSATWPKALAVLFVLALWRVVVWTRWRPEFVLPSPVDVLARLWADVQTPKLWNAVAITLRRGIWGFGLAI